MKTFDRKEWAKPAEKFKALGHPVRLWIAQQLVDGEKCVHEFVEQVNVDFSTVSQHLSALKAADIVETDKRGKEVFYRLKCDCVRKLLECVSAKMSAVNHESLNE